MDFESFIPFIIVFAIILAAILLYNKRNPSSRDQYDERQEMLRKNAYKYSGTAMVLCAVVYFLVTCLTEKQFAEDGVSALLIAFIGIAVFAVYSIFNDAFFGIRGRRGNIGSPLVYVVILAIIIVGNGIGAVRMIQEHMLIRNGMLTSNVMNLALAALFLLILICLAVKYAMNVKEERGADL